MVCELTVGVLYEELPTMPTEKLDDVVSFDEVVACIFKNLMMSFNLVFNVWVYGLGLRLALRLGLG